MKTIEIRNAIITGTTLGPEDHGIFSAYLHLDYGDTCQSFGGYSLDDWHKALGRRVGTAYGAEFILCLLKTLEAPSWEKLKGMHCRVRTEHCKIHAIGHFIKDSWFCPEKDLASFIT